MTPCEFNLERLFAKLKFVGLNDLFDRKFIRKWVDTKFWHDYDAFLNHLMLNIIHGPDNINRFKKILESLDIFDSAFNLVCHIDEMHKLPTGGFVDQLIPKTLVPTTVKPTRLWITSQKEFSHFTYNIYQNIVDIPPSTSIFGEKTNEQRERNHAHLVYCYCALTLQIQDHLDGKITNTSNKFKMINQYFQNLLLVISRDEFEVARNGECITDNDRYEFSKYHLVNMIVTYFLE